MRRTTSSRRPSGLFRLRALTRPTKLLATTVATLTAFLPPARAADYTWNGTGTPLNWNTAANWTPAGPPTAADTAIFGGTLAPAASQTVVITAGDGAGTLVFDGVNGRTTATSYAYTIGATAGSALTLGGIDVRATNAYTSANQTVAAPLTYAPASGSVFALTNNGLYASTATLTLSGAQTMGANTLVHTGRGTTAISGVMSGTGGVTVNGGTLNLSGANTYTGPVVVNAGGVLGISNAQALGATTNTVTVNAGGALRTNTTGLTYAQTITFADAAAVYDTGNVAAATFSGTVNAPAGFTRYGTGTTTFSGNLAVGGPVVIGSGVRRVIGANIVGGETGTTNGVTLTSAAAGSLGATLAGATSVTVNPLQTLTAVNTTNATANRLGAGQINLVGGLLAYTPSATTVLADTPGAVSVTGFGVVANTVTTATGTGGPSTLAFGNLNRTASDMVLFRGLLGNSSAGAGQNSGLNVTFANLTASPNLNTTSAGLLPWAGFTASGTATNYTGLATYDGVSVRGLYASERQVITTGDLSTVAGTNADVQGSVTVNGPVTINSFQSATGSPTLTGTGTLTIASGAFGANFNAMTVNGPTVAFGGNRGYVHLAWTMNFNGTSALTGSNGITIGGAGATTSYALTLAPTVTTNFTGGLAVSGPVRVRYADGAQLGNNTTPGDNAGPITLQGGILSYNGTTAGTLAAGRVITVGAANGSILTNTAQTLTVNSLVTGPGQLTVGTDSTSGGTVVFANGANTFTGGIALTGNTLGYGANGAFGTGPVFSSGTIRNDVAGGVIPNDIVGIGGNTINTNGNATTVSGALRGGGGGTLTKTGAGTLTLTGASPLAGDLAVTAGAVTLAGPNGSLASRAATVAPGTTFTLDNTAANNNDRFTGGVALTGATGGTFGVLGNATTATTELLGALDIGAGTTAAPQTVSVTSNGQPVILRFGGLTLAANSNLLFTGTNLGPADTVTTGAFTRIFFNTPPVADGALIAGATFNGSGGTGLAQYSFTRGVVRYTQPTASGTVIDNFGTDGTAPTGPAVATNTQFTTTGAAVAKLGASLGGLTLDGGSVLLRGNVYNGSSTLNLFDPIGAGGTLTSQNGAKTISLEAGTTAATINFGTLTANVTTASDLTIGAGITLAGTVAKNGAATLLLNNSFSGTPGFIVNAGTVRLGAGQTLPQASAILVNAGGTFDQNGTAQTLTNFTNNGTYALGAANLTLTPTTSTTQNGVFTGTGGILFNPGASAVTVTLGGNSTFSGGVSATGTNAGTIGYALNNTNGFGTGPVALTGTSTGVLTGTAGGINFTGLGAGSFTVPNAIALPTTASGSAPLYSKVSNQVLTFSGQITGGNAATAGTLTLNTNSDATGVVILTNPTNNFRATIDVYYGVLGITSDAALGNAANTVVLDAPGTIGGLRFYAPNITLAASRTFTPNGGQVFTNGFDAAIAGPITGTGSFNKGEAGTLTVSGTANTHTGTVGVNAGALSVTGTLATGTNAVSVNTGGTLNGTGTINRPVTVSAGGAIRGGLPGAVGTLTTSNGAVTVNAATGTGGGRVQVTAAGGGAGTASLINNTGGAFTLAGLDTGTPTAASAKVVFDISSPAGQLLTLNQAYTLTVATASAGIQRNTTVVGGAGAYTFDANDYVVTSAQYAAFDTVSLVANGSNLTLTFTPVPEPGTVLAAAAAGLGLASLARRRLRRTAATA